MTLKWHERPAFILKLRSLSTNNTLSAGCREVLKQTLKTVEADDGKRH